VVNACRKSLRGSTIGISGGYVNGASLAGDTRPRGGGMLAGGKYEAIGEGTLCQNLN